MRILLVKPAPRLGTIRGLQAYNFLEPLELGYLAAAVPGGHEVRVTDLRRSPFPTFTFRRALDRFCPDLVGFTAFSHDVSTVNALAVVVRSVLPKAQIVVGGHHATVLPGDFHGFDAVVRGEGCVPFRQIVEALASGGDLEGIAQVVCPDSPPLEIGAPLPPFPDPALLPTPRRDLWKASHYRGAWVAEEARAWSPLFPPVAMVRSSWGCRMRCTFCIVPFLCNGQHRPRPADLVAEEIAALSADHVYFCDDETFLDEGFAWELARAIERRGIQKRYYAWARATTVNRSPKLLKHWRSIGLDAAFLGFEFSSDSELKKVRKGATVAANEQALDTLRGMGVAVHAGFMVRPEYDAHDFSRLQDYIRRLPPALCTCTVCTPSPGTPDYEAMRSKIWVDNAYDLHDAMHPLVPTKLSLREFTRRYAAVVAEGTARTPRRIESCPTPPGDLMRAVYAGHLFHRAFRSLYRDYPRELWERPALSS